jgi:type IV pili sensor histidine kinase/response regulator
MTVPAVRYGRYTLAELGPVPAQKDLLLQVIDVAMPETQPFTVGDALRRVLLRSGYSLCSGGDITALNDFPLPAPHYKLGPMTLLDALLTLTGPAWQLHIDRSDRRICVTRARPRALAPLSAPAEAMPSATVQTGSPFTVLGLVSHGGERFVSIRLAGTEAPATRVMRLGETVHGWRLVAIDDEGATFRRGGRVCRVAVP